MLIPFKKQLLTGYVVDLHNTLEEAGIDAATIEIKSVEELFDTEPLVTPELLELTKWIADYYFAPWGETIKSCLPAGINAEAETMLSLTTNAREALSNQAAKPTTKLQALAFIATHLDEDGEVNSRALSKEFTKTKAGALIRELEKSGLIIVTRQMIDAAVKPKKQQAVRLSSQFAVHSSQTDLQESANRELGTANSPPPTTDQQQRVLDTLASSAEPIGLAQLQELASVSISVIKTLEKRGHVEVFVREVRRDPLAHLKNLSVDDLALMPSQQVALDAITEKLNEEKYAAFLLHGVTGSGKTEVYIRAMRATLGRAKLR